MIGADADGWRVAVDHGAAAGEGPAACPPGTRVRVEGLFDKVPVRRKFLRSPRAEYAACLDAVRRLAMARPDVAFTLDHDGRRVLTVQPSDAPSRVAALLDSQLAAAWHRHRPHSRRPSPDRGRLAADLQSRHGRPPISVRQSPPGEGPAARRVATRRLPRPAAARPPPGRRLVSRSAGRGGRHQRPPGQDRSPLPRSLGGARADHRRPAQRTRRSRPPQRRAHAVRAAGGVDIGP